MTIKKINQNRAHWVQNRSSIKLTQDMQSVNLITTIINRARKLIQLLINLAKL